MLWIRKDIEAEQIAIQSSDLTAAVLHLPERKILIISIYIPGQEPEVLTLSIQLLDQAIQQTRTWLGTQVDAILAGDFNRHDQLLGGNEISVQRQGEADPIIDFMATYNLQSLLPLLG